MLRLKIRYTIVASSIPLILLAVVTREWTSTGRTCVLIGDASVQIVENPWQAQLRVSFTDDPRRASVRVQIIVSPETADFTLVDDSETSPDDSCVPTAATRAVAIVPLSDPVAQTIYVSTDGNADYRIFVRSNAYSPHAAAALLVGANGGHPRLTAASL